MRKDYLAFILVILMAGACKKHPTEFIIVAKAPKEEPPIMSAPPPCSGDVWTTDLDYAGFTPFAKGVYNNKAYFFNYCYGDFSHPYHNKITIFDGTSWQVISSTIPFDPTYIGFSFVIGSKAYLGITQYVGSSTGNCYVYDFPTGTWSQTADYPGTITFGPAYFTIDKKGYVAGGNNETWEFDPLAIIKWTRKANYPGADKDFAAGFSIDGKGYMANGVTYTNNNGVVTTAYLKGLFEYNPSNNTWTTKTGFPGLPRERSQSFVISQYGYVGGGRDAEARFIDFYRYDPAENDWIRIADYNPNGIVATCFSINSKGYAVWTPAYNQPYKMKKYTPRTCVSISPTP